MIDDIVIDESEDFERVYVSRRMRYPFPVVTFVTRSSGITAKRFDPLREDEE